MRNKHPWLYVHVAFILSWLPAVGMLPGSVSAASAAPVAAAHEIEDLKGQVASLTRLVETLSARLEELENARAFEKELAAMPSPAPAQGGRPAGTGMSGFAGSAGSAIQNMNPDISVVGVAVGKWTDDRRDPERNTFRLHDSEVVLTRNVSPYTRANLTLGFHDGETHVEEGYADVAHLLPGKLEARVGRFLVPVGFLNTVHSHDWPMPGRPLPLAFFHGGEHGFSEGGLSLSTPIDLRSKTYVRLNADVLHGESTTLFNDGQTRVFGSRLLGNTPLNDRDDLNWGMNVHRGAWSRSGDLDSTLYGADLMWRRRFSQFERLSLWGEWLWNRREQLERAAITAQGYYLTALYRFRRTRDWHVGLEYDCTEKPGDTRFNAVARSVFAGYWLTENDRLQLQFRRTHDPFAGRQDNEVLLQFIWGMGPHKPHLANF